MTRLTLTATAVALVAFAGEAAARDQIRIVGSSTVFPFSTAVAEQFGRGKFKTPVVESTGTGGGFKLFCAGVGESHPDITNASRAIKKSEYDECVKNGVKEIAEVKIGFDGIVLAQSKAAKPLDLKIEQVWLAVAKEVPKDGKLVANPYRTWKEIDPSLPADKIEILGPPPTSGTRDAFVELALDVGCQKFAEIKALDPKAQRAACQTVREDGAYIDAGENDNLIVQKLKANPAAMGVFGYSFLDQNRDALIAHKINGVEPTYDNISAGKYAVSRSLFFYVKNAHAAVVPGIREFVAEFTSDKAMGPDGYLADKGLIALPDKMREQIRDRAANLEALTM